MSGPPSGQQVKLSDGTPALIRQVYPGDSERLKRGVKEMSQTSRYMRFFASFNELDDRQARYFTEIDQVNHIAWCGVEPSEAQRGYGLARFVRDETERDAAHFAVAVIDAMQGIGLGNALLAALHVHAPLVGIRELRSEVLRANPIMGKLMTRLGGRLCQADDPRCVLVRWPVVDEQNPPTETAAMQEFVGWMQELRELVERAAKERSASPDAA